MEDKQLEEKLVVQYHKRNLGDIAQFYKKEDVEKYFYFVVSKLKDRYPNYINLQKDFGLISSVGTIFTVHTTNKSGFFDLYRKNIGINHFLSRITTALFHESVHKLSSLKDKGDFDKLPHIYKEVGTEIVTGESLKRKDGISFMFSDAWGIFPNTHTQYKQVTLLTKQLASLSSEDELLEKSILEGTNEFSKKMIAIIGEKKFEDITRKIDLIANKNRRYMTLYGVDKEEVTKARQVELKKLIEEVQVTILGLKFDKRVQSASSVEDAESILNDMLEFSDLRMRFYNNGSFHDDSFKRCFENTKKMFQDKFKGHIFSQEFDSNDWKERFTRCDYVEEISVKEREEIKKLSRAMQNKYNRSIFDKILGRNNQVEYRRLEPAKDIKRATYFEDSGFKFELDLSKPVMQSKSTKKRNKSNNDKKDPHDAK